MIQNNFIDLAQAATLLNLTQSYLYELVAQRKIPFYKPFGKKLYFKLDELEEIMESSKVDAKATSTQINQAANSFMLGWGKKNG